MAKKHLPKKVVMVKAKELNRILAIETSCDETSVAIVDRGTSILSHTIFSQAQKHNETKGVVPEVAAREHLKKIIPMIKACLQQNDSTIDGIDALAVTTSPGLIGSLLVGTTTAETLATIWNKPLLGVNHIEGHIYSTWIDTDPLPQFPILILSVSGGHNDLILMKDHGEYEILGSTLDDASGEAYDKCAKIIGLPYPGGPHISKHAEQGKEDLSLPSPLINDPSLNFSFSGLKTATLYKWRDSDKSPQTQANFALSVQNAINLALEKKVAKAVKIHNPKEIHLTGGVSANKDLRKRIKAVAIKHQKPFKAPSKFQYCTDNAAMIGCAAYFVHKFKPQNLNLEVKPNRTPF